MFEKMGNSGLALRLVGCTNFVPHHVSDDGGTLIGNNDDLQAVTKGESLHVDVQGIARTGHGPEKRETDREKAQRDRDGKLHSLFLPQGKRKAAPFAREAKRTALVNLNLIKARWIGDFTNCA